MLLFANKMGVHWYFRFAVKTADNTGTLSKYITFQEMLPGKIIALMVLNVI